MPYHEIHIACPRTLRPNSRVFAAQNNLILHEADLLSYQYATDFLSESLVSELAKHPAVFTSAHAVRAVASSKLKNLNCFCINGQTKTEALNAGFTVLGDAPDGVRLAQTIIQQKTKNIIHFCGNIIRPELKNSLAEAGIDVDEIVVYHKTSTPKVYENFDAVLFFSPSQVDAFLEANVLAETVPAFCIGETTANHLKKLGHKMVFTADEANEKSVLQLALTYFRAP